MIFVETGHAPSLHAAISLCLRIFKICVHLPFLYNQKITSVMKKISTLVFALVFGCLLLAGCDKIEGDFYEIVNSEDVTVEFPPVDPSTVYRKVLLEEFTGHRCTNCPAGHAVLESLHQQYGDTLVTVGIHYGSLAKPVGSVFNYDFRTEYGDLIGDYYTIDAIPAAIVNRVYEFGGWSRDHWANVVSEVDRSKVYAALQVINEFNEHSKKLKANVKVTMLKDFVNPLRIVLFVIEDGIVKPQKDGDQDILDYVHNHVLRASLTNTFGFPLRNGSALWVASDTETYAASISLANTDWVPENCSVVAFLYDETTEEVIQVEQVPVK